MIRPIRRITGPALPLALALAVLGAPTAAVGASSPTLAAIEARGTVRCGVHPDLPGFSEPQPDGTWRGFDADVCRAVAAAVLGDPDAVDYVPIDAAGRQAALADGTVDLLSRNTTWTLGRESSWGTFVGTTFYDGQTVLTASGAPVFALADKPKPDDARPAAAFAPVDPAASEVVVLKFGSSILRTQAEAPAVASEIGRAHV